MGRSESYRSFRRKPELNPLTEVYQPVEIQNEVVRKRNVLLGTQDRPAVGPPAEAAPEIQPGLPDIPPKSEIQKPTAGHHRKVCTKPDCRKPRHCVAEPKPARWHYSPALMRDVDQTPDVQTDILEIDAY